MKKAFIALFIFLYFAASQASADYVVLNSTQIEKSPVIKDLRQLGAEFVIEKGTWHTTKTPPFPGGPWTVRKTFSISQKKLSGGLYYFKYNVELYNRNGPTVVNATYVISFRPSNGKVSVISYRYFVKFHKPHPITPDDSPGYANLGVPSNYDFLDQGVDYTVKTAIAKGELKNSTYSVGKVYSIYDFGNAEPPGNRFLLTLIRKDSYTIRVSITVLDVAPNLQDKYHPTYIIYSNKL